MDTEGEEVDATPTFKLKPSEWEQNQGGSKSQRNWPRATFLSPAERAGTSSEVPYSRPCGSDYCSR